MIVRKYRIEERFLNDINVPTYNYFLENIIDNWEPLYSKVNFINKEKIEVFLNYDEFNTFWWVGIEYDDGMYYYKYEDYDIIANGKVKVIFSLDIYLTYLVYRIHSLGEFLFLRNPILDKNALMFNDPLFNNVKYTGKYDFEKQSFVYGSESNYYFWQNQNVRIAYNNSVSKNEVVNGVMYAVFNAGQDGKYIYIPILSKSKQVQYQSFNGEKPLSIVADKSKMENGKYYLNQNNKDKWSFQENNTFTSITFDEFVERMKLNLSGQYSASIYATSNWYPIVENSSLLTIEDIYKCYWQQYDLSPTQGKRILGNDNFSTSYSRTFNRIGGDYNHDYNLLLFEIFKDGGSWDNYTINNSYTTILNMRKSTKYANKFLGFYFLPHILFMKEHIKIGSFTFTWLDSNDRQQSFTGNLLYLDLLPEGNTIYERQLTYLTYENNPLPNESNEINNWYLTRYFKTKYYNNDIDLSFYYDENSKTFKTRGYFNFTGSGNYVAKVPQKSITECLWTYPYQLPSGSDEYLKYVAANYNSVNTGLDIAKQQFNLGIFSNLLSGAFSVATSFKNPLNLASGIANSSVGITNNTLNYYNKQKMVEAQFMDAKNTNGTQISNSTLLDSAWINYYLKDNEQYSGLERFYGDDSFNKQLNSIIYYYSYFNPKFINLSLTFGSYEWDHYDCFYLQWDENYLRCNLHYIINQIPKPYHDRIFSMLTNGLRFWNI